MRIAATTALAGLREHRPTSVLLVLIAAAGLGAALPVASLMTWPVGQLSRLRWAAGIAGPEQGWAVARTAGALQEEALRLLFQALFGVALAAFAISAVAAVLVFTARARERAGELTLRRAVGARRRTLLLAALVEGGLLGAAALVAGGAAGMGLGRAALAAWPGPFAAGTTVPAGITTAMMIGIMLGGAGLAVVFAPSRLTDALPRPAGLILPSVQLGTALVILSSGALFIRQAASSPAAGRPARGEVYSGSATLADPGVRAARYASLLQSLKARTRFDSVSLVSAGTVVGLGTVGIATTDCGNCPWGGVVVPWHAVATTHRFVSADSFQALAVHLVAGRGIAASDTWDRPPVAVVSRGLAERHFQNGDAIGRRMLLGDDRRTWHTVVGIVDDPPTRALGSALLPPFTVYASVLQHPAVNVELLVRRRAGAGPSSDLRAAFALALGGRSGGVRATDERALVAAEVTPLVWFGRLFAAEGWAVLAIAGLACAVQMGLWVRSRAPELGLRRAVGASRWQVVALVLARAAAVGLVGTVAGLAFGPAVWSALGTMVAGLPAWDSGLVLRYAAVLVTTSTAGGLVPAWRAAGAAPARLLAAG